MGKGPIIAATVVLAGVFLIASSSGASPSRPPFRDPIPVPPNDVGWDAIDEALCLCWEADQPRATTVACVLARVYPEVPWPAVMGDHPSVFAVQQQVGIRVVQFQRAIDRGEQPCRIVDPVEPPPPPQIDDPFSDTPRRGKLNVIRQGGNPTQLIRAVYGLSAGEVLPAFHSMNRVGFNLYYYSRPHVGAYAATVGARAYDIGPAWLPANADMRAAFANGERPLRQVSWSGAKLHAGAYGSPWLPAEINPVGDPWEPSRNPPAEVLEQLGLDLASMRTAWEAGNGGG